VAAGPTVKKIMAEYGKDVRLVIKNAPYKYRTYAYIAAKAFLSAAEQGKAWEMYKKLLGESPRLSRQNLLKYAEELGLDLQQFTSDIDNSRFEKQLNDDRLLALRNNIFSTPTYFINGRKVVGERSYDYMKKILDEELAYGR